MKMLVSNNFYGSPILWEYDEGLVERIDLIDFNTHQMVMDSSFEMKLPRDLMLPILEHTMNLYLESRNFGQALQLCFVCRQVAKHFYKQIYQATHQDCLVMLFRLGKTYRFAEELYEGYLATPNINNSAFNACTFYRQPTSRFRTNYNPWEFRSELDIQTLNIDPDNSFRNVFSFPGQFNGDTIFINGTEDDGIYDVSSYHHPVIVLILADYAYSLIPARGNVNDNWHCFARFVRRAFGENCGIYMMVKHQIDLDNPFIETTDIFAQI